MSVQEEINNISDTIKGLKEGFSVEIFRKDLPVNFRFVKSAMFDVFTTPEEWRDLSIQLKENADRDYIGYFETQDSLYFKESPAASVTLAIKGEYGDTLVQHQLVVFRGNNDLYYLNYVAPTYLFDEVKTVADSVFNSFRFK